VKAPIVEQRESNRRRDMIETTALDPKRTCKDTTDLEIALRTPCLLSRMKPSSRSTGDTKSTVQASFPRRRPIGQPRFPRPNRFRKDESRGRCRADYARQSLGGHQNRLRAIRHSHEIAKPIGSPPVSLGHRETQALPLQEVLNQNQTDCHITRVRTEPLPLPRQVPITGSSWPCLAYPRINF
jgi:hypothetical protein